MRKVELRSSRPCAMPTKPRASPSWAIGARARTPSASPAPTAPMARRRVRNATFMSTGSRSTDPVSSAAPRRSTSRTASPRSPSRRRTDGQKHRGRPLWRRSRSRTRRAVARRSHSRGDSQQSELSLPDTGSGSGATTASAPGASRLAVLRVEKSFGIRQFWGRNPGAQR
jgi:hypothetical protein